VVVAGVLALVGMPGLGQAPPPARDLGRQIAPDARRLAEEFFHNPFLANVEVSPDGSRIAALLSSGGQERIVVRDLSGGPARPIVGLPDPEARFRWLRWANDTRLLYSVEEPLALRGPPPRPRRTRLYAIDSDGSNQEHLAKNWARFLLIGRGEFQFEDWLVDMLEDDPRHVLMAIRKPVDQYPGVYELEVNGGGLKPIVLERDGVVVWHADHHGVVRAGYGYQHEKYVVVARRNGEDDFVELAEYGHGDDWLQFEGFAADRDRIYVSKSTDEGYSALYEYDLKANAIGREVLAVPGYDVPSWLRFSDTPRELAVIGYVAEGRERHFLDEGAGSSQEALDRALPGTFNRIVSESRDRSVAIVHASSDTSAPSHYVYRPEEEHLTYLAATYPALEKAQLSAMEAVTYEARDGRTIPGFLTRPKGAAGELPAVIYPHGGPSARDLRGFDPVVQYFAALGFAVLQPNFRGSTGLGDDHQSAGDRQWGLAMQDDITDGARWLVESGIADAGRVCIFGTSYGGYAALMALVKTPELFRCGASYAGPTDLVMMLNHDKGYQFSDLNVPTVGSSSKDRARLRETSPLENVDKIRAPVFLAHGEDDSRVHVSHSQKLAKLLNKAGKPVELMILEHEAHSIRGEAYRIELYARLGEFLLANTAPRADRTGSGTP
jgi:dipeptidyl aminopeptidase/acylaminoacyl peptidase